MNVKSVGPFLLNRVHVGNCIELLKQLPDSRVQCCVSSPPYWGLRDYGTATWEGGNDPKCEHAAAKEKSRYDYSLESSPVQDGAREGTDAPRWLDVCPTCGARKKDEQIGIEPTPEEYVDHLVEVFREVRRALWEDGTLWLNLGDSYNAAGRDSHGTRVGEKQGTNRASASGSDANRPSSPLLKPKDLVGIPWRVAFALQADGWYLRQDIIWCLSGGAWVYARTQKGVMPLMIKDMARLDPATVQLWNGRKWTRLLGMSRHVRRGNELELVLRSGERISCTPTHQWPTNRGLLVASDLVVGDVLDSTVLPEPGLPRDCAIDLDAAWFAGLYLAEGSRSSSRGAGPIIQLAGHSKETVRWERVRAIAHKFGGAATCTVNGNNQAIRVSGKILNTIIDELVSGRTAVDKGFAPVVWRYSNAFVASMLDGYLSGDGFDDGPNRRWRLGFTRNYNLERDLRVACARLDYVITLKPTTVSYKGRRVPTFRGEIRKIRSGHHNERSRCEVVEIRKARCRSVWDIGVEDDPHTFALASGVLTHNSKGNCMPESVTDRCTKSHEYIFLLAKSESYYYDMAAMKEPCRSNASDLLKMWRSLPRIGGKNKDLVDPKVGASSRTNIGQRRAVGSPEGRNRRSVWTINPRAYAGAHFACVDAETECLTAIGWKRHGDLQPGVLAAQYDLGARVLSWAPVEGVARYDVHDQDMVVGQCRDMDMWLTPNHRTIVQRRHPRTRLLQHPVIIRADELKASHAVPTAGEWAFDGDAAVSPEWAELIGWYVAEGHECKDSFAVELYQSSSVNADKCQRIEQLLRQVGAEWTKATCKRMWRGRAADLTAYRIMGYAAVRIREMAPGKRVPWGAVLWARDRITALVDGLIGGDGHTRLDGRREFVQKDMDQCDLMQVLAMRLGYSATVSRRRGDGIGSVYITKHRTRSFRGTAGRGAAPSLCKYTGVVWCPKLPYGTWVARRKGKPFITGNTFPPELPTLCIKAGTKPGDVVLDPFCGSGTTGEAALLLDRNFIGFELNPKYANDLAQPRLDAAFRARELKR